jgi:hypothetical protein
MGWTRAADHRAENTTAEPLKPHGRLNRYLPYEQRHALRFASLDRPAEFS